MAFKGDAFDKHVVDTTFATNFYGLIDVCDAFFPIMKPHGRVVHVASSSGKHAFNNMSKAWRDKVCDDDSMHVRAAHMDVHLTPVHVHVHVALSSSWMIVSHAKM